MAKKSNSYFEDFIVMIGYSCNAAKHLESSLSNFSTETLKEQCDVMHQIENEEDDLRHDIMKRLMREFIPPIDREDIIELANELDNVTDKIEDILLRIYMSNVQSVREDAILYTKIIVRSCETLKRVMEEFPNFRKSTTLNDLLIEVNTIEEEGDRLYINAVRRLFESSSDPVEILVWSKMFDLLEDCCDTCEHVANVIEGVMMKNA